jgi:hypothetical protein
MNQYVCGFYYDNETNKYYMKMVSYTDVLHGEYDNFDDCYSAISNALRNGYNYTLNATKKLVLGNDKTYVKKAMSRLTVKQTVDEL